MLKIALIVDDISFQGLNDGFLLGEITCEFDQENLLIFMLYHKVHVIQNKYKFYDFVLFH